MDNGAAPVIEKIPVDFLREPYELYARLRREGPAREVVMPNGVKVWMVTRYHDVRAILGDPRISKDGRRINELFARHSGRLAPPAATPDPAPNGQAGAAAPDPAPGAAASQADGEPVLSYDDELSAHMLNSDPPRHARLRILVGKAFTARRVQLMRPRIERLADELLDRMAGRPEVDLIAEYALPLPITVITELLGVPVEDRETFREQASMLVGSHHSAEEVEAASAFVIDYSSRLVAARRAEPGEDLLSAMVHVRDGDARLTDGELVAMVFLLVAAGHETTMSTLGNAIHSLLRNPGQLAKLRANPGLLAGSAFDELVRYDAGVSLATFRFTTAPVQLGGVTIPAGEILAVSLGSAGRDERRFVDADTLDLDRRVGGASLAFGHGIHYCVGAALGRMEVEIAITRLLARHPDLRLAVESSQLRWKDSNLMHGLVALPVTLDGHEDHAASTIDLVDVVGTVDVKAGPAGHIAAAALGTANAAGPVETPGAGHIAALTAASAAGPVESAGGVGAAVSVLEAVGAADAGVALEVLDVVGAVDGLAGEGA